MKWSSLKPADRAAIKLQHLHFGGLTIGAIRLRDWRYVKSGKGYTWEGVESAPKRPIVQPIKARKMWSNTAYLDVNPMISDQHLKVYREHPVLVLSGTKQAYEQMVESMAHAIAKSDGWLRWADALSMHEVFRDNARAALSSIGITEPRS